MTRPQYSQVRSSGYPFRHSGGQTRAGGGDFRFQVGWQASLHPMLKVRIDVTRDCRPRYLQTVEPMGAIRCTHPILQAAGSDIRRAHHFSSAPDAGGSGVYPYYSRGRIGCSAAPAQRVPAVGQVRI